MNPEISTLYSLVHELLYLGTDGSPIYSDSFSRLNREVYNQANNLYSYQGATPEEEASLYLSLLMAYSATLYDNGDKQDRIQHILNRCWAVLDNLPVSPLKAHLLTYCYGEVYEDDLLEQARAIIATWDETLLTPEQTEIIEELKNFEDNQYPFEVLEE
ncbi:MAG: UpxZ family transcription anti-terminator antagonist [Bacteroides sp.]|nr:UpxZ family transcription anti-terminator antagonist [Bacteroides sp.]